MSNVKSLMSNDKSQVMFDQPVGWQTYNLIRGRDARGKYNELAGTKTKTSSTEQKQNLILEGKS